MIDETPPRRREILALILFPALWAVAWLWPIGLGGKTPVGGDVTQFSIGLMKFLGDSLREGRLPLWNDLWGYGFPGLGESQMGVFYPPHLVFYGLLPVERAYVASLVFHTLVGAWGAAWAARRFGISVAGSILTSFAWTASGFFVIHLPHQWGYTTGCWTPWAWGAAWGLVQGERPGRCGAALSAVLALQLLPGHFQLGFIAEISVAALLAFGLIGRLREGKPIARRGMIAAASLAAVFPLAAMQLGPTLELARLASSARDWDYLAGFAATPVHLISYVAPGLFHRSPLWRTLAWDAFHTSPEEYQGYVGLVPLMLAVAALGRRDKGTWTLVGLLLVTLALSLGPYFPGSRLLFRLPGFSFFRAPARWSIATSLALALLAGRGFDSLPDWRRPGRRLVGFAAVCFGLILGTLAIVEGAFAATEPNAAPASAGVFERLFALLPWEGDPSFRARMFEARQPWNDMRARTALARRGEVNPTGPALVLAKRLRGIYVDELTRTMTILAAIALCAVAAKRTRALVVLLLVVAGVDLLTFNHEQRPGDLGPIRPLVEQSPILAMMKERAKGGRVVDGSRNLPMVVGAAPVSGYRTLDLPILPQLTALTREPLGRPDVDPVVAGALRATGVGLRVLDPFENRVLSRSTPRLPGWRLGGTINDPALAGWIHGADWVAANAPASADFTLLEPEEAPTLAWFLPRSAGDPLSTRAPTAILDMMKSAVPLKTTSERPESLTVEVPVEGDGYVIVAALAHPGWRATWDSGSEATVSTAFGGWRAVARSEPSRRTLRLDYRERYLVPSLVVSAFAWTIWLGLVVKLNLPARSRATEPSPEAPGVEART